MQAPKPTDEIFHMLSIHEPVLLKEVLQYLNLKPGDCVVDGTIGGAGHAEAMLKQIGPQGFLVGIDQDESALARSEERLKRIHSNFVLKKANFSLFEPKTSSTRK